MQDTKLVIFWQKLESLFILIAAIGLYWQGGYSWPLFFALFLMPDISMAGYLLGPRIGAHVYNLAHIYAIPALLTMSALIFDIQLLIASSLIWTAHIAIDRALGFGIKSVQGFKITHLS